MPDEKHTEVTAETYEVLDIPLRSHFRGCSCGKHAPQSIVSEDEFTALNELSLEDMSAVALLKYLQSDEVHNGSDAIGKQLIAVIEQPDKFGAGRIFDIYFEAGMDAIKHGELLGRQKQEQK